MIRSFVDTGVWSGYFDSGDSRHYAASELITRAETENWQLMTTNAVVLETHAFLVNRVRDGNRVALGFLAAIDAGVADVVRYTKEDETNAVALLRTYSDKGFSLCDAISFVVMERLGIPAALSFDKHFQQYGQFQILH